MDSFAPIAGISLEQYAELCAVFTRHEGAAEPPLELLQERGISLDAWSAARTGWTNRLEDPIAAATLGMKFVPAYHAALDRVHGPAPALPLDVYAALSAEVQHHGLSAALGRLGLARHRFSQIAFAWDVAFSRDSQQYITYVCLLHAEMARLSRGEAPRPIPPLHEPTPTNPEVSNAHQAADPVAVTPAVAHTPVPAPVPMVNPAPGAASPAPQAPGQVTPAQAKSFEQEASEAANAVGSALKSGLSKLGGALDAFGKSLNKPSVGMRVLVAWSDGHKYPGVIAEIGQGQYFVTMTDGRQLWVPEAYVSSTG